MSDRDGYVYAQEREAVFSEDGQRMFLQIRDRAKQLLREAGAFRMDEVIRNASGSSWQMLACVDRLVELGEIHELILPPEIMKAGQNRCFTDGGWRP